MSETINDRDAARRLAREGRWQDLRRLLLTSVDTDTGPVNAWCRFHETHGTIEDYLDDVEPARRAAAGRTDAAVEAGEPAPALHDEIWFGLVTASLRGRRTAVTPDLLELAVADGVWSVRQAVAHLHRDRRIRPGHGQDLLGLLPHAPVADRPELLALASAAVAGIPEPYRRVHGWIALLPHLAPGQRAAAVAAALDAVLACHDAYREEALAGIVAHLSPRQLERAAVAAADSPYPDRRARMLALLVPHAPDRWLPQLFATALASTHEPARAHLLAALAPRLPAGPRRRALAPPARWPTRPPARSC
ncbi:hypothetical protein Daura_12890 [Dactylosporangium aurantiacum]|uniref:Uncharacterized protein n=1 Tax=Dactylosporangium aurantiacum TaxID=35754 RepID=A0A9Q9MHP4_9ACTN|nr:hypothetical protein [Dactylosporangium aurantiacum]MDG6105695.1 hypothetical protein [Dactylosporangium aurantiacum]UWZ56979.1 hypothetical protein Daura_12890 [Dactylosporangium aurantiacum]